jgi:S-DNA-T family DNA segregation ATPase FtsK/SpoIIIE
VVRRLILIVVIVVLLYVLWDDILKLFGYGLIIIAIALGSLVWVAWRRQFSVVKQRWNWILGGISLALAVWGILAFFQGEGILKDATLGGSIGQSIIGASKAVGGLRVAGLALLGIIFIIPWKAWSAVKSGWRFLIKVFQPRLKAIFSRRAPAKAVPLEDTSPEARAASEEEAKPAPSPSPPVWQSEHEPILTPGGWHLPPIDILDKPVEMKLDKDAIDQRARLIEEALVSYGVEAKVVQVNIGPTVTQFGVEPGWDKKYKEVREKGKNGSYETKVEEVSRTRVRVDRITSLANDLALALAAPSIRIEAPVPGAPVVGIEVPNTVFGSVALRGAIESAAFQKIRARSKLAIALGKGAGGEAVAADLTRMPHLLIAGATGSGKTVCLNSVICCLLLHNSPDDVRFIMIDPKRVELVTFNGVPQLLAPVVVDTDKAIKALRWLNQEMDSRYRQFAKAGARNIEGYNKDRAPGEGLPYLVLLIDELADLMMTASDEVEHTLCRLAQLARATGIHLVVATQRPSVDVVTGLIKANFPTRISFAVTSQVDSRTILDMVGAEKLLGRGDMLYMPTEASKPKRLQGSFVSDAEIERLVYFWGNQRQIEVSSVDFDEVAERPLGAQIAALPDPLFEEAKRLAQEYKHISTSFLQRRLRIGYPRAARLMEALQQAGLVEEAPPEMEKS